MRRRSSGVGALGDPVADRRSEGKPREVIGVSTLIRIALALGLLATGVGFPTPARADGSWLAAAPSNWNTPGQSVPVAPPRYQPPEPRCNQLARPPATYEDDQVSDAGWLLTGGYLGGWDVYIVRGNVEWDGMCRPLR